MTGTNPIATWTPSNNATQTPSAYKSNIDGNTAVCQRFVDNFAPTQTATPAMTVSLDAGHIFSSGTLTEVAAQTTSTITAPVSHPRIDRVVINSSGVVSVITGTPASSPIAPAITAGSFPVAQVLIQTTSSVITNSMITDERDFTGLGVTVTSTQPVIASIRNGKMSVTSASATATYTADEIIVETALGGTTDKLASYSESINLATTGAGGMDTGAAPASGYVSLYAIWGTSGTNILACNATTSTASIYGGAHMPSGYTQSALLAIWPTNGSSQFIIGFVLDRQIWFPKINVLNITSSVPTAFTSQSLSAAVPPGAVTFQGIGGSPSGNTACAFAADANGTGEILINVGTTGVALDSFEATSPVSLPLITSQVVYYKANASGTATRLDVNGYTW